MKNIFNTLLVITSASFFFTACTRSVYVSENAAPHPGVMHNTAPYPGAVWIPEEYIWRNGRYILVAPHYTKAPRGHVWVSGHWSTHRGRSVWTKGYWRR